MRSARDSDEAANLARRSFSEDGRRINIEEPTGTCYSFVFWFNHSADVFSTVLTFAPQDQVFAIHLGLFEKDCYRTETFDAENIVENLLLGPFGYFLPPASRFWCESISGSK